MSSETGSLKPKNMLLYQTYNVLFEVAAEINDDYYYAFSTGSV